MERVAAPFVHLSHEPGVPEVVEGQATLMPLVVGNSRPKWRREKGRREESQGRSEGKRKRKRKRKKKRREKKNISG